jgi:hypothetical protein
MQRYFWAVSLLLLSLTASAEAANLYIDPNTTTLKQGDAVALAVRLDTDELTGECVNAVDGVITYDASIEPVDISIGKSIFPVWVEVPTINKANRTITFAGGIPNGYCGRVQGDPNLTNTLVELIFKAPVLAGETDSKVASIAFGPETTAYLNDGLGTKATLQTYGATVTLSPERSTASGDIWTAAIAADTQPPEAFSVTLATSTLNGEYYIVFNTTDKQTGVSYYEVLEESNAEAKLFHFGALTAPWVVTRSPFILKDQTLRSVIRVKAVDKAGNEYLTTFVPDKSLQTGFMALTDLLILAGLVLLIGLGGMFWWTHRERMLPDTPHHNTNPLNQ